LYSLRGRLSPERWSRTLTEVADEKENHSMATIFETVRAQGDCSKYVRGIESTAGLAEILRGPGPFTLFVPTDAAFDRLSSDKQAKLFADPETLSKVLRYHIVPGYYTANDLLDRLFLKTLEGQRLRVWSDISMVPLGEKEIDTYKDALNYIASETVTIAVRESITINGAQVIRADVKADNGILHVLDKVLLPPFTRL
jgi:uncharacterized surface protein with fasciclin (FAS1) repeats